MISREFIYEFSNFDDIYTRENDIFVRPYDILTREIDIKSRAEAFCTSLHDIRNWCVHINFRKIIC